MFNKTSRTKNAIKLSSINTASYIVQILVEVLYRKFFIQMLAVEYLGLNGLFANILQVLSLSELGLTRCISFRLYNPIRNGNSSQIACLLDFLKKAYRIIALAILILGLVLIPFLPKLIHNSAEIPNDINLTVVYLLFLLTCCASYLFTYPQTLLQADQRGYEKTVFNFVVFVVTSSAKLLIVCIARNYTLAIISTFVITVVSNFILSLYIKKQYPEVFSLKEQLSEEESKAILLDVPTVFLHKFGGVVQESTENIVISAFVGLTGCGLFSNYSAIITAIKNICGNLVTSVSSTVGSAGVDMEEKSFYEVYKRIILINYFLVGYFVTCTYVLMDDFILIWLGSDFLLDKSISLLLCVSAYITCSRNCNWIFINDTGLIVKDPLRPVLSSVITIVLSIVLVKGFGIAGVLLGTIIASVSSVLGREVKVLYRYRFKNERMIEFWVNYFKYLLITVVSVLLSLLVTSCILPSFNPVLRFVVNGLVCSAIFVLSFVVGNLGNSEFKYWLGRL